MMMSSAEQHWYHTQHAQHAFGNQHYHNSNNNDNNGNNNSNNDQNHEHAHLNHNHQQYPQQDPPPPTEEPQDPSALWLLKQASVHRELKRMATRLIERQRRTDDPGVSPCLFVVLPKTSRGLFSASAIAATTNSDNNSRRSDQSKDDFWLYFLCDCGFMTPESTLLSLHVCSPPPDFPPPTASTPPTLPPPLLSSSRSSNNGIHTHGGYGTSHHGYNHNGYRTFSPPTTVYPGGYQLKDLDKFVEDHAWPMLSLLYLVEQANEDPAWTDRIRGGVRFLAEKCREDLWAVYQTDISRCKASRRGRSPGRGLDSIGGDEDLDQDQDEDGMTDDVELEDDDDEDEQGEEGDEEAEGVWMTLREDDFRDPYKAAGKSNSNNDNIVDGINFGALDLNRDHATGISSSVTATEQSSTGGGAGGLVLGADVLCQVNFPYIEGGILWLCAAHNEMLCKGMAAAKLRDFIKAKGGHCIPMEKSAEIQFRTREDARVFYGMLDEYKCVIKLKVGFEWEGGVTEEDLWELCATVHSSTVRDLTIDCAGLGRGADGMLTFRPMLGMMCRLGFTTLTVENFDGLFLSPEEPLSTLRADSRRSSRSNSSSNFYHHNGYEADTSSTSSDPQFSLQDFRMAPTIIALPDNIQVKKLTFRHWARVPDRRALVNLIKVLPNLTELETMTDSVELLCASIQEELQMQAREFRPHSVHHHHPLSHLNLLEVGPVGSKVELSLSKPSGPDCAIRIQETQWKTNKTPDSGLLQSAIGLETLEFTQCVRLWERGPELQRIIACNYSTLRRVEIVCSTDQMASVWVFLRDEFVRPTFLSSPAVAGGGGYFGRDSSSASPTGSHHGRRISAGSDNSLQQHHNQYRHRRPVHLRIYDCAGHTLESSDVEQLRDETILQLDRYDDSFRAQLELQSQIADRLRISQELTDLVQLAQLTRDVGAIRIQAHQAGWEFRFYELVVCLTRVSIENVAFLQAIWNLMDQLPMVALTVQLDSGYYREGAGGGGGQAAIEEDQIPRPQDVPRQLLEAFARLRRVDLGRAWNGWYELWMQELLVQEMLPIWRSVALPTGLPVQGWFVFTATESLAWTDASSSGAGAVRGSKGGGRTAAVAGVVYSLTFYR
ncbi:hypothetical protein BGZ95_009196 [Linnemannia exigua]|uniref:Uncharacterized protein n=1 Tax=Linnemannia exigua TaxID=604196 RepID=A0AAD4H824_9FUNG|nr:hypothetical protein BGZ95_009196 [Linnemannia exigua]